METKHLVWFIVMTICEECNAPPSLWGPYESREDAIADLKVADKRSMLCSKTFVVQGNGGEA